MARTAEEVLRTLCELQAIADKGNLASYDEQRKVRNEMRFAWHEARLLLGLKVQSKMEPTELDKRSDARKTRRKAAGKE